MLAQLLGWQPQLTVPVIAIDEDSFSRPSPPDIAGAIVGHFLKQYQDDGYNGKVMRLFINLGLLLCPLFWLNFAIATTPVDRVITLSPSATEMG